MAKEFFQETNDSGPAGGERGNIRQAVLLVLLLLTAGLGYIYFFTGLIKPREHITIVTPPCVAPVKQPLPPRPTLESGERASTTSMPEEKKPVPPTGGKTDTANTPAGTKPAAAPVGKPSAAPVAKPAAPPAAKPIAAPAVKTAPPPAVKTAPPPAVKSATAPLGQNQSGKVVKPEEKPAVKTQQTQAQATPSSPSAKQAKGSASKVAALTASRDNKPPASAVGKSPGVTKGKYTLLIGGLANDWEAEKVRSKTEKQGITGISVRKVKKTETMHRLFLGDFDSQMAADAELSKLKAQAGGSFILKENGRYAVYAGSYLHESRAAAERKRLVGKGVKLEVKTAKVTISVSEVLAGSFPGNEEAQKAAGLLKKKGLEAKVVQIGQ